MSEKKSCLIGWLIIAALFAGLYAIKGEASEIAEGLSERYPFPKRVEGPVYWGPKPDHSEITVYGTFIPAEREQIIEAAKIVRREKATKPVHLRFYDGKANDDRYLTREEIIP